MKNGGRHRRPAAREVAGKTDATGTVFLISVIGLFLEMLLIRWISTEVRIFAYLQNTILVVCFLGMGLGFFTSRQPARLRPALVSLAILALVFAVPVTRQGAVMITDLLSAADGLPIWSPASVIDLRQRMVHTALGLGAVFAMMVLIVEIFVPIGRILGRLMDGDARAVKIYSVNVAGSLAGTWLFVLLSAFHQPPFTWFAVLAVFIFFIVRRTGRGWKIDLALLAVIVAASWFVGRVPGALLAVWSPYQKLVLARSGPETGNIGDYIVTVNNTGYQVMIDPNGKHAADPYLYPPAMRGLSQYDIPPLLHPRPKRMLIVGAGTGNDAAGALRHRVKRITAVEIDPAIIELGRAYHPEQPYASLAVDVVIDDARSFFASHARKYDVIVFGLLDSHTTTAMTNARLDHYVYTRESIGRARSLLMPGGIVVLSFEAQKPYIADRMARVLREIFGEDPIAFRVPPSGYGWGGVLFVAGDLAAVRSQIGKNPELAALIDQWQRSFPLNLKYETAVATDDWPYIYLEKRAIPGLYYLLAGLMALLFLWCRRRWKIAGIAGRWQAPHWHFFFLGAAFLLLEVQGISKASVALGNTWQVNAVVVSAALTMVLAANATVCMIPRLPPVAVYTGLTAACLALYAVDPARFAFLPYAVKALLVGSLVTLPMFFGGIIFIRSYACAAKRDEALGANMIGALAGALLQPVAFVTGNSAMMLIVAGFYGLALLTGPFMSALRVRLGEVSGARGGRRREDEQAAGDF